MQSQSSPLRPSLVPSQGGQPTRLVSRLVVLLITVVVSSSTTTAFRVVTPATTARRAVESLMLLSRSTASTSVVAFTQRTYARTKATTKLNMAKNRGGLEQRREGATPLEGGMTLYVKAGPDGTSLGDCPFAHYVRMVLETKGLDYELKPCVQDTKPGWLKEFYDGKMPALRHRKECYVESDTIAAYLEFFFPKPELSPSNVDDADAAAAAVEGLFPAVAQYVKHTPDGDEADAEKKANLGTVLRKLNDHLSAETRSGPYLVGDGSVIRMNDCKLAPVLYHMCTAVSAFKGADAIDLANDFPAVKAYTDFMFETDPSFQKTVYPREVVTWGWGNARGN